MQGDSDPYSAYVLVLFESEEMARRRGRIRAGTKGSKPRGH